jgi:EpsD family peptidyl-prolyl cis-trans isomerase
MVQFFKIIVIALITSGCGQKDSPESQTLAIVNGDQITLHQLQAELKKAALSSDDSEATKKLLASLVDRQLLVQEALKFNLDRSPEIVEAVESSKAQIYAQAYMSKKLTKLQDVSDDEVSSFISHHPEMFEHRRLFKTVDIIFANSNLDIKTMETKTTTLEALESELNAKSIMYDKSSGQFLTDRLPLSVLPKISHLEKGDLLFAHNNNSVIVKSIEAITEIPVTKEAARSLARRILSQQAKQEFVQKEIVRLKELSTIKIYNEKVVMQLH